MTVFTRFKRFVARLVLRGRILDFWLRRKMRRLERHYLSELVRGSRGKASGDALPALKRGEPLRRILVISDVQWEHKELVPELEKICPVTLLNLHPAMEDGAASDGRPKVVRDSMSDFIRVNTALEPEVIFFYARSALLSEEVFDTVRRRWSCPLLGMNLDDKIEFLNYGQFSDINDNYQRWARHFDLNLSNVRAVVDWYSDRGLPVCYVPEGYHPKPESRPPDDANAFDYEIAFVGRRRVERELLINQLRKLGVPVEPIGFGWPNSKGVDHPEAIYRRSMISLGIGFASPSQSLTTLKARDFECPGAGACYLTTFNWELAMHYEIGKEILCYRSVEELVELFSFYRRRPEACQSIAQAAYRRCLAEHTWEKRFRKVLRGIGFAC